jgi:hypothetical protein
MKTRFTLAALTIIAMLIASATTGAGEPSR